MLASQVGRPDPEAEAAEAKLFMDFETKIENNRVILFLQHARNVLRARDLLTRDQGLVTC